jgi:hypothetical protein
MEKEMDQERQEKLKKGLLQDKFEYLTSYKDINDGEYVWMSLSIGKIFYIVETEHSRTKYYKRFSDALRYFEKNEGDKETWIDLTWPMPQVFGHNDDSIMIEDLDWIELQELDREE